MHPHRFHTRCVLSCIALLLLASNPVAAQRVDGAARTKPDPAAATLDSLIARAMALSPRLRASEARSAAAQARIKPAGLRPDPMVMAGVQNMPIANPGFDDDMTMKMVGVTQTIPLWGKLGFARDAARRDAEVANAQTAAVALEIRRDVRTAYYELAYVDRALEIVASNRLVLIDLIAASEIRFATGFTPSAGDPASGTAAGAAGSVSSGAPARGLTAVPAGNAPRSTGSSMGGMGSASNAASSAGGSAPLSSANAAPASSMGGAAGGMSAGGAAMPSGIGAVLRARLDAVRLAEQASMLREQRREVLARLNSLIDRPADAEVAVIGLPQAVVSAAVAATARDVRFESAILGSRASGSPLPSVDSLQRLAIHASPALASRTSMVAAQSARAELTLRERRPDIEASIEYGQRSGGRPDMVTATVSIPLFLHRAARQDQYATESRAILSALEADRADATNQLTAEVVRLHAAAERIRTQLALYQSAVLPQTQLSVDAARFAFETGSGTLTSVLDAQADVFNSQIAYHRALADFARTIAELEQVVGVEVIHD